MKNIISVTLFLTSSLASAQVYVQPYVDRNGTYHQGHMRSAPDGNQFNNYSTQGNLNPYTGQPGTVSPYAQPQQIRPVAPQPYGQQQQQAPIFQQLQNQIGKGF